MRKVALFAALLFLILVNTGSLKGEVKMRLSSPDFKDQMSMPRKLSCDAEGNNPALIIEDIPAEAKSLALIADDPDAPGGTFVHWVVFDIPLTGRIEPGSVPGRQGVNSTGGNDYVSPCPPSGTHRYFFKVYALDTLLGLGEGITKGALEKAMQGHILDQAEIVGLYQRGR